MGVPATLVEVQKLETHCDCGCLTCAPLLEALAKRIREHTATSSHLHSDETGWRFLGLAREEAGHRSPDRTSRPGPRARAVGGRPGTGPELRSLQRQYEPAAAVPADRGCAVLGARSAGFLGSAAWPRPG